VKTAVDTNVLLDILGGDRTAADAARRVLGDAVDLGAVVICPIVYAELASEFAELGEPDRFLSELGLDSEPFVAQALWRASEAWRAYVRRRCRAVQCSHCGRRTDLRCPSCQEPIVWRQHLITDFLIGAHASVQADVLVTRDPGYYRTYFPQVRLDVPTSVPP
jgi:predicted nucleic acid-binding protein